MHLKEHASGQSPMVESGFPNLPAEGHKLACSEASRIAETHRAAQSAKLPVKYSNDAVLRGVENEVIELVVSMHDSKAELLLVGEVGAVPRNELVEEGDVPGLIPGLDVSNLGLNRGDFGEGLDLAREVVTGGTKVAQANLMWVNRAEGSECFHSSEPASEWLFRSARI